MFYTVNKLGALVLYGVTLASYFVALPLPAEVVHWLRVIVGVLFVVHALELLVYKGPLLVSMGLTMLFGILHWKPLADARR